MTDIDKGESLEAELEAATKLVRRHEIALAIAKAQRDGLLLKGQKEISRRRAGEMTGLTSGRVQQVIDKTKATLSEANYRVVVQTDLGDALKAELAEEPDLILFGGHGAGSAGPGEPLPPITKWSIYARAESEEAAEEMVKEVARRIDGPVGIWSVEPFDPNG